MKKQNLIVMVFVLLFCYCTYGQDTVQETGEKLATLLNEYFSDSVVLNFKTNKAYLNIGKLNRVIDIRHESEIARDSMQKKDVRIRPNSNDRFAGPIYWRYSFEPALSSETSFRANRSGQLFLTMTFSENDTISIKSALNKYTCHHRGSDSALHQVLWSGDKYISLLLQPSIILDTVQFKMQGITISGKFEREDLDLMHKAYTKALRDILKREFESLFDQVLFILDTSKDTIRVESKTEY